MTNSTELVLALVTARAKVSRAVDADLGAHHGVSLADFALLRELGDAPGGTMRRGDLAGRLGVTPSGVTRQLGPLERIGLVERVPHARDARLALAGLTDTGRRVLDEASATAAQSADRALSSRWSADEQDTLHQLLARA